MTAAPPYFGTRSWITNCSMDRSSCRPEFVARFVLTVWNAGERSGIGSAQQRIPGWIRGPGVLPSSLKDVPKIAKMSLIFTASVAQTDSGCTTYSIPPPNLKKNSLHQYFSFGAQFGPTCSPNLSGPRPRKRWLCSIATIINSHLT